MIRSWLASHKSLVATATSSTVIVALITTVAIISGGYAAQRTDLNDSAVWVTNQSKQALGRANTQILQLNSIANATGHSVNVVQDAGNVLLVDSGSDSIATVDTATSEAGKSVPLPPRSPSVQLAGDQILIASQATGQLWVTTVQNLPDFTASSSPTIDLGGQAITSMDSDGTLFAFQPGTKMVSQINLGQTSGVSTSTRVPTTGTGAEDSLTSVGGRWALLDPTARKLYLAGGTVNLAGYLTSRSGAVLQSASTSGDTVYIATSTGLLAVPTSGGKVIRVLSGSFGTPAAPVTLDGCTYAGWNDGTSWQTCGSATSGTRGTLPHMAGGASLSYAVNGDRVLLNDVRSGSSWAVQHGNALINNWADLIAKKNNQEQVDQNKQDTPPQYVKTEEPPVAVNDEFGARPGRISPLPVLLNDYDPNGDVLVISSFTAIPAASGTLNLINDDQQLQITLPDNAAGVIRFQYTITDGQGGSATATVTVTVRTPNENSPPVCLRPTKALVQSGGSITSQVLGDCYDPDGDPMYLSAATVAAPDTVTYTPQGTVVYNDKGKGGTLKEVGLEVSDGRATGTGTLAVTIRPPGSVPIIADPFAAVGYRDQNLTISPLAHVRGGTGTLRLSSVPAKSDATISADYQGGTFQFSSDQVGTHLIEYTVTDGVTSATGTVRIEVQAPPAANLAPIAVTHTAFIREQTTQDVNVLATDIDPAGGVLLVTGVTPPAENTGIRVQIIGQMILRVTLGRPLVDPVDFHYILSNGLAQTQGTVTVVQLPPLSVQQPPVANPDSVSVRVGDTANIPVLANDEQPDGEALTLSPILATPLPSGAGLLFTSGNELRYLAPTKPGNFTAAYKVYGADGQWATAQVKISVRERDAATNNPPVPKPVTARVLAGDTVRITVPLDGIDPDGDSVQFLGQQTNPSKGAVVASGTDWLDYQAGEYSAGTDTFTYGVVDSLGAHATGTIRVGIADRIDGARNPVAVEDDVTVRPGKSISVQVLANDSDPDGSPLTVTAVQPLAAGNAKAVRDGNIVKITAPAKEGLYSFIYTIQNERGGSSENFIRVDVNKNAPLSRPVASDTDLSLSDILNKQTVVVNVLANVFFADGPVSTLRLSVLPGYADRAVVTPGKRIRVTVQAKSQIIPFQVVHPDDSKIVAYAFIRVPGYQDALPQLRKDAPKLTVTSENTLTIHLNDIVVAAGGKQVRLTDSSTVRATHSNGSSLVVNDTTLSYTSAARYFGTASIAFQVTDGTSATDPNGKVATLVVPITVTPRTNQPPSFTGALIDFEPGQSKTINLVKLTSYPYAKDQNELTYSIQNPRPDGVSLNLSGQQLTIKVDESTPKGAQPTINIGVRDAVNAGQSGRIQISVVPSTRPLAIAQPDTAIAPRGKTTTVDVLANDAATNPFPSVPLKVIAVQGLDSANLPDGVTITPTADNSVLSVTVSATAAPVNTTLQYEVADATNDPSRYVWGTVTISVEDRPSPVTNVQVTQIADHAVTLTWSPGEFNNSPITGFQVTETRADSGAAVGVTACPNTVCTIQTPGNGPENAVNLAVQAKNALGLSDPVSYTSPVWSNVVPSAPTGLSSTPLDSGLRVTWTKPPDAPDASPITAYIVTVGGVTTTVGVPTGDSVGTGYSVNVTDPSLGNGVSVPFSVASTNDFYGGAVIWSSTSSSGIPSGAPIASASAPSATPDLSNGTSAVLNWGGLFADNGKAITSYFAGVYTGSAPSCTVTGVASGNPTLHVDNLTSDFQQLGAGTGSVTFNDLSPNTNYSFIVYAYNGQGCTPSAVATATPRTRPGAPRGVSASVPGGTTTAGTFDIQLNNISPPDNPGGASLSYEYQFTGAFSTSPAPVPASGILTGGPQSYGQDATLQIRTIATYPGGVTVPASSWLTTDLGLVPVSTQLSGLGFAASPADPATGQFTWSGWPIGSYRSVQYSCDGGATMTSMPGSTGSTLVCTLPAGQLSGTLTVTVVANSGTTYQESYASQDYQ